MGIVRLAKCLKLLGSLDEYSSRKADHSHKISGNRVYMDFISIVYRIQEHIADELNYLLFSFILIESNQISPAELESSRLKEMLAKYHRIIPWHGQIPADQPDQLKQIVTIQQIQRFVDQRDQIQRYIYEDVVNYVVDMLTHKVTDVEYILISFDGIPSFAKIQEQRQRRYMRYAFMEFKKIIIADNQKLPNGAIFKARHQYDQMLFLVDIKTRDRLCVCAIP